MTEKSTFFTKKRLLLFLTSLVASLALAELVLRVMPPLGPEIVLVATTGEFEGSLFTNDPALRVVPARNARTANVSLNRLGIRGPGIAAKANGEKRVLALGDSFTMGLQVKDGHTFSDLLTDQLGPDILVMNAGVAGYGTEQATGWMGQLAEASEADAAILTMYTGNDLRDNAEWAKSPGMPESAPPVTVPPPPRSKFVKQLAQYSRIVSYTLMSIDLDNRASDFRIEEFREEILPFADPMELPPLIPPTRTALQRFGAACTELQLICGVALVPPAYVVHPERVRRTWEAFGLDPDLENLAGPSKAIQRVIPKNLPVIDLTSALKEREGEGPYLVFDPHFSAAGHRIAADALAPFVTELLTETP
jgi:lysophospholipase L1-like esterase